MLFSKNKNKRLHSNSLAIYKRNQDVEFIPLEVSEDSYDYIIVKNEKGHVLMELSYALLKDEKLEVTGYKELIIIFMTDKDFELGNQRIKLDTMISESEEVNKIDKLEEYVQELMTTVQGDVEFSSKHDKHLLNCTMEPESREYVEGRIRKIVENYNVFETEEEVNKASLELYSNLYGLSIIQELDDDMTIGEILVNATDKPTFHCDIYYYRYGVKYKYEKNFETMLQVKQIFSRLVNYSGKELNEVENAMIEATRPNKDRINISIPMASETWSLNIRKFTNFVPTSKKMHESGTVNEEIEELLKLMVRGKANIGIGGGMGTGKTTFINYLLSFTKPMERKTVIASVPEMSTDKVLKGHDVVVLNVDESRGFTFDAHMRLALRTTADRIVIPESRGQEFKQVYEANLKTQGNMFTAHAKDDISFFNMCVNMYLSSPEAGNEKAETIADSLAQSMQIVIIMRNVGGKIRIKSISEVLADENNKYMGMNPLIVWDYDPENPLDGRYVRTKNKLSERTKTHLNENGVLISELNNY